MYALSACAWQTATLRVSTLVPIINLCVVSIACTQKAGETSTVAVNFCLVMNKG